MKGPNQFGGLALARLFELTGFTCEAGEPLAALYRKEERWQDLVQVLERLHASGAEDVSWEARFELAMVYSEQLAQHFKAGEVIVNADLPEALEQGRANRLLKLYERLGYWVQAYELGCHILKDGPHDCADWRLQIITIASDKLNLQSAAGELALAGWQAGEHSSALLEALRRYAGAPDTCVLVAGVLEDTPLQGLDASLRQAVSAELLRVAVGANDSELARRAATLSVR